MNQKVVKIVGNKGLMGKTFEVTETYFSGGDCTEDRFKYAERVTYTVKSKEVEDGVTTVTTTITGAAIALKDNTYNSYKFTCNDKEINDQEFYDISYFDDCTYSETNPNPLQNFKDRIADNDEQPFSLEIDSDFMFDNTEMSYQSSEGCKGISFGLNLAIIIIVVVVIIVIVLIVMFCCKKSNELPITEKEDVEAAEEAAAEQPAVEAAAEPAKPAVEAAAEPAKPAEVAPAPAPETAPPAPVPAPEAPAPAPAPAPEPTPAPAPAPEAAPAPAPEPIPVVVTPAPEEAPKVSI